MSNEMNTAEQMPVEVQPIVVDTPIKDPTLPKEEPRKEDTEQVGN